MKKKILLFMGLVLSLSLTNNANAQCAAPLTVTNTGNPGEVELEYDLQNVSNQATFIGYVSFYNTTTQSSAGSVTITQNNNPENYTFTENGIYEAYSTTYDSLTTCSDSTLVTFVVSGLTSNIPCSASFVTYQDSLNNSIYYGYNTSNGTNLTYYWDFGDGTTSTAQYPSHTYSSIGTFNICLTIDDGQGCTSTSCDSIVIFVKAGTTVNFVDQNATAGIENNEAALSEVNVYPNPTMGDLTLQFTSNESKATIVQVIDMKGSLVFNTQINSQVGTNNVDIDLNDVEPGMYFYRIDNDFVGKVLVK
jgi:PKD repeat protein